MSKSSTIKIDKNVPLPKGRAGNNTDYRALVEALQIGDSFVLNGLTSSGVWSRLLPHARRAKIKLTMRAIGDGVRVWRIE